MLSTEWVVFEVGAGPLKRHLQGAVWGDLMAGISLLASLFLFILWIASYFGVWCSLRRAHVAYYVISTDGDLIVQRANLRYETAPSTWTIYHDRTMRKGGYGVRPPLSPFDYLGLVDTLIRIPWGVTGNSREFASSIDTTGRSVTVPEWVLLVIAIFPTILWAVRKSEERREKRRRGFDVLR